jgi:acetyltransferase
MQPSRGEFALAVADAWQGQGLAGRLLRRLCDHASRRGLRSLFGDVLHDNLPMLRLARRQGFAIRMHPVDPRLRRVTRQLDAFGSADGMVVPASMHPDAALAAVPCLI